MAGMETETLEKPQTQTQEHHPHSMRTDPPVSEWKRMVPPLVRKPVQYGSYRTYFSDEELREIYRKLLIPRLIEERMLLALRKGQLAKWFSAWGQEAISVGVTLAIPNQWWMLTMHRNLGVFTTRGVPLDKLFAQLMGKDTGFTRGRERSFHFGLREFRIVGMISHVSANLPVADGIALAHKLRQENQGVVAFTGEGATSEGDFHEALNIASVWQLPVLFIIENNGYAISTPAYEQYRGTYFAERARAYHIPFRTVDGNNILEVILAVREALHTLLNERSPFVLECLTFRMRGHEEASGTDYVPPPLREFWSQRDPVSTYEQFLIQEKILSEEEIRTYRKQKSAEIREIFERVYQDPEPDPTTSHWQVVYAPSPPPETENRTPRKRMRYVDAIREAHFLAMERFPELVVMGQDIGIHGGVFKVTKGLIERFGPDRVRNTPLCESGIVGVALGLSIAGMKAVVEMQFSDFVSYAFTQIVNHLAKIWWRWRQHADVVIRMPTGAGVRGGPFHSQSTEGWFVQVPGLKVVYPSTAYDAKGLLLAAVRDPNPVLFYEHKFLYRHVEDEVPEGWYEVPIGKARLVQEGDDLTILTYGWGVHQAVHTVRKLGISADILDMRTLLPYDQEAIAQSVRKTGKVLILYEPSLTYGIGNEWSAWISQHLFTYLDAPIFRVASRDTPVPFAGPLEDAYLPWTRLPEALQKLAEW